MKKLICQNRDCECQLTEPKYHAFKLVKDSGVFITQDGRLLVECPKCFTVSEFNLSEIIDSFQQDNGGVKQNLSPLTPYGLSCHISKLLNDNGRAVSGLDISRRDLLIKVLVGFPEYGNFENRTKVIRALEYIKELAMDGFEVPETAKAETDKPESNPVSKFINSLIAVHVEFVKDTAPPKIQEQISNLIPSIAPNNGKARGG